jgi:hypothetical protein
MALFLLENRDSSVFLGFRMIFKVSTKSFQTVTQCCGPLTVIELNLYLMVHSIVLKFEKIWLSHTLNIIRKPKKSLFSKRKRAITQERYFLGLRMIFKVWLNQIFSNFNTMLWTIKYRLCSITVYFTFTVPTHER